MNKYLLLALMCVCLASCDHPSLSPMNSFYEVQQHIVEQTGNIPHWKNRCSEPCSIDCVVQGLLGKNLTIENAVEIALLNNQRLQSRYENLGIAQAQLVQAGLLRNPIFSFSIRPVISDGSGYFFELTRLQDVLEILLIPQKKRAAAAELSAIKAEVTGSILELIGETEISFLTLIAETQILQKKEELFAVNEASYEVAKRLYDAGNITTLALDEERLKYEKAKIEIAESEIEVFEARERLNVLMGLWGNQIEWNFNPKFPEYPVPLMIKNLESQIIENNLELQIARQQIQATAAKSGIEITRNIFQEFTFGPDLERESDGNVSIGPAFSFGVPLFDQGQARTAAAYAELRKQWSEYQAMAIETRSQGRSARWKYLNAERIFLYYQKVLEELSEKITRETHLQYNAMQLGVFHLLNAKRQEVETVIRKIQAEKSYWMRRIELEFLLLGQAIKGIK